MRLLTALLVEGVAGGGGPEPLPCQPASLYPWPIFHIVNNVTTVTLKNGSTILKPRNLNDANGIFQYKGVWHAMNQAGGGTWSHAVSHDGARWAHVQDALVAGPHNSSWDHSGPCDGTVSFPDLGVAPYNGSTPIILYGPDCAEGLKPPPPAAAAVAAAAAAAVGLRLGDAPRVEPATPADPTDPLLREWVKTQPGPVTFEGIPCSFPGRVWKSKVGNYWNMLCSYDVGPPTPGGHAGPWVRYSSTDPALMKWKLADLNFTNVHGAASAGALFHALPGAPSAAEGGAQNAFLVLRCHFLLNKPISFDKTGSGQTEGNNFIKRTRRFHVQVPRI
jgi:hypothetical protein